MPTWCGAPGRVRAAAAAAIMFASAIWFMPLIWFICTFKMI
jgi:hypothetical protein